MSSLRTQGTHNHRTSLFSAGTRQFDSTITAAEYGSLRSHAFAGTTSSMASPSPQVLPEKLRRPAPSQLGGLAIVHRQALLVAEAVLGVVPIEFQRLASRLHALLEALDQRWRAPIVLGSEMRLQGNFD